MARLVAGAVVPAKVGTKVGAEGVMTAEGGAAWAHPAGQKEARAAEEATAAAQTEELAVATAAATVATVVGVAASAGATVVMAAAREAAARGEVAGSAQASPGKGRKQLLQNPSQHRRRDPDLVLGHPSSGPSLSW